MTQHRGAHTDKMVDINDNIARPVTKYPKPKPSQQPQIHEGASQDLIVASGPPTTLGTSGAKPLPPGARENYSPSFGAVRDIYKIGDGKPDMGEGFVVIQKGQGQAPDRRPLKTGPKGGQYWEDEGGHKHYVGGEGGKGPSGGEGGDFQVTRTGPEGEQTEHTLPLTEEEEGSIDWGAADEEADSEEAEAADDAAWAAEEEEPAGAKWDGSTDSGSEWARLRGEGMSHQEAVDTIEGGGAAEPEGYREYMEDRGMTEDELSISEFQDMISEEDPLPEDREMEPHQEGTPHGGDIQMGRAVANSVAQDVMDNYGQPLNQASYEAIQDYVVAQRIGKPDQFDAGALEGALANDGIHDNEAMGVREGIDSLLASHTVTEDGKLVSQEEMGVGPAGPEGDELAPIEDDPSNRGEYPSISGLSPQDNKIFWETMSRSYNEQNEEDPSIMAEMGVQNVSDYFWAAHEAGLVEEDLSEYPDAERVYEENFDAFDEHWNQMEDPTPPSVDEIAGEGEYAEGTPDPEARPGSPEVQNWLDEDEDEHAVSPAEVSAEPQPEQGGGDWSDRYGDIVASHRMGLTPPEDAAVDNYIASLDEAPSPGDKQESYMNFSQALQDEGWDTIEAYELATELYRAHMGKGTKSEDGEPVEDDDEYEDKEKIAPAVLAALKAAGKGAAMGAGFDLVDDDEKKGEIRAPKPKMPESPGGFADELHGTAGKQIESRVHGLSSEGSAMSESSRLASEIKQRASSEKNKNHVNLMDELQKGIQEHGRVTFMKSLEDKSKSLKNLLEKTDHSTFNVMKDMGIDEASLTDEINKTDYMIEVLHEH